MHHFTKGPALRAIAITLLLLGIFLRFYNIDKKVYWDDEAYTSLHLFGHTEAEIVKDFLNRSVSSVGEIQKYLHVNTKGVIDTVMSLVKEDPQHPPFYYILGHYWTKVFGDSVVSIRSLSVVVGSLAIPAIYWLALELFNSSLVGALAAVLVAISPLHVLYSQEAREYSLWTLMILLMNITFLRAVRRGNTSSWVSHTIISVLAFYTYPLSLLVSVSHGCYLFVIEKFQFSKSFLKYLCSFLVGILISLPWILVILFNVEQIKRGMELIITKSLSPLDILKLIFLSFERVFFDQYSSVLFLTISILIVYSFYFIYKYSPLRVSLFVLLLIGFSVFPMVLSDLFLGGHRTQEIRYFIPACLGLELSVAYLLASQFNRSSYRTFSKQLWSAVLTILISAGIASCLIDSQADTAWIKLGISSIFPRLAPSINQVQKPLLISDGYVIYAAALSYRLQPHVSLYLRPHCYLCTLSNPSQIDLLKVPTSADSFLFLPSQELKQEFSSTLNLSEVNGSGALWKIVRQQK